MRKQIPNPSTRDIQEAFRLDLMANFNCHRVGIIKAFNAENQTASIQIVDKRVFFTYESEEPLLKDYSLLLDCPVYVNASNEAGFTRPINVGDECLVLFNDRNIDNWFTYGTIGQPRSNRMHDFSDGLAIVGFRSAIKKLTGFSTDSTMMYFGETIIELDDMVKIENEAENLKELIDELFLTLQNLEVTPDGGVTNYPINATTSAALTALQARFDTLLK